MISRIPEAVLARWQALVGQNQKRTGSGLINDTFVITPDEGERVVVQRQHTIFGPEVNQDIQAITTRLGEQGLTTPRLIPADDGELCVIYEKRVWRAMSFVPGHAIENIERRRQAFEAGALVGRFHKALEEFEYEYRFTRSHVHDTPAHLARLRSALDERRNHDLYDNVERLARVLLEEAGRSPDLTRLPLRHAHGDLKISNVLFDDQDRAICLIDLDTLARMAWPLEMGDALRSWCNPRAEDRQPARLELDLLEATVSGYASAKPEFLTLAEREALVDGLATICLELTARFLADALNESYFGWDAQRYSSRGEHNLVRAEAMWALYCSVCEQRPDAERIVAQHLPVA